MKLKYAFEKMELEDRIVAVPVGEGAQDFRSVIKLNESASEILDLLQNETTEEEMINTLKERYEDDPMILEYVRESVEYLMDKGVLE